MKRFTLLTVAFLAAVANDGRTAEFSPADLDFFESKVRPLLVTHCGNCHSDTKKRGGLALSTREALLKGGDTGPALVPGKPAESLLIQALVYKGDVRMPPKGKLADADVAVLTEWVQRGAPWPTGAAAGGDGLRANGTPITEQDRAFWSFRPVTDPPIPTVKQQAWCRKPLDHFVLAKLEAQNLRPVAPADKRALLRRATFDLIGLPPTPEEIDAFLADESPEAFARVVDRLLASPHYGERWGRHWLDVARYGEDQAHTFQARLYPQGWRYRDWVVKALNDDMPFDRFLIEQIAGDLLKDGDPLQHLPALGLFACGPVYYRDAGEAGKAEAAEIDDRIDTLCRGVLGLTVACARCHDHKFDPITVQDYYGLAGIFRSTKYVEAPLTTPEEAAKYTEAEAKIKAQEAAIKQYLDTESLRYTESVVGDTAKYMIAAWKLNQLRKTKAQTTTASAAKESGLREAVLERWMQYLFDKDAAGRATLARWNKALAGLDADKDLSTDATALETVKTAAEAFQSEVVAAVKENRRRSALLQEVVQGQGVYRLDPNQLEKSLSEDVRKKLAALRSELETVKKNSPKPPTVHTITEGSPADARIFVRGDPKKEGDVAPRRFLQVLAGDNAPRFTQGSGRLELAKAIASKDNPLTARVFVNRVWMQHFGRGIVTTPSNFGSLGARPTHPALLDHLASRFMANGWSIKALHREIMLSAAYQLSGDFDEKNASTDAGNVWLWRMNRRRMDVESWRDAMLAVSGNLDPTLGGPSQELTGGGKRRTLYAKVSRHNLNPLLRLFDFPDPNITSEARTVTTVPLQQLFVLNSDFMVGQARALVKRLATEANDEQRIRKAHLLLYGRPATEEEVQLALEFVTPEPGKPAGGLTPWEQYAQVLLGANEFIYLD